MTPKDKSLELINKMMLGSKDRLYLKLAKQCAIIAVDEIIAIKLLWHQKDTKDLDYWNEVKQEIEKL